MSPTPPFDPHDVAWTPEKVARIWSFYASNPSYRAQYFSAHSGRAIVRRVEGELPLRDRRVLDFGCGRGDLLGQLFARGIAAAGLEFSRESAEEVAARFAGEELFQGVSVPRGLPAELEADSFDVVFFVEVVEHLLDDQVEPTLAEVRRLLAPGGHVVVTAPNDEDLDASLVRCPDCGATFHRWQHQRAFSATMLAQLFRDHGFEARRVEALYWGASRVVRLRARIRRPRSQFPRPHLLYIGQPVSW